MDNPNQDVKTSDPSTEEQVVNETVPDQQSQEQQTEQTDETSSPQEVKPASNDVDERGVPLTNVYHEMNRKLAETQAQIQQLTSALQSNQTQVAQPTQNQVPDEQLLWCIEDPNATPEAKFYARNEMRKRDEAKQDMKLKSIFNNYQEEQSVKQQRSQAFGWFASNFPDAVNRDTTGNAIGINDAHPLVQRMSAYLQDPMAAKRGDALIIAAKNAAFDLGYVANKRMANKVNQTTAQLRKEQKKTLIAGSGVNPQDSGSSSILKVADDYKKTQNPKSFKELIKKRGLMLKTE